MPRLYSRLLPRLHQSLPRLQFRLLPHYYLHIHASASTTALSLMLVPPATPAPSMPLPPTPILMIPLLGMTGRTRGETGNRSALEKIHQMGVLAGTNPGGHISYLASQSYISEALREHGLPPRPLDLPTAYAIDLPTPAAVEETDGSEYSEILEL